MRQLFDTLRVQLVLLVILALMPALFLAVYTAAATRNHEVFEARRDAVRHARQIAQNHADSVADTRDLLLTLPLLRPVREADSGACNNLFPNLLKQLTRYVNLGVATANGQLFCSSVPVTAPVNLSDATYFRRALDSRTFAASDYHIDRVTGKPAMVLAYPFPDEGAPAGVVFAALDLEYLSQMPPDAELPRGAEVTIVHRNGSVVAHWPDPQLWIGQRMGDTPVIKTILAQKEGIAEAAGLDGVPRLFAFAPLGDASELYVSVGIPTEALFAEADRGLVNSLGILAFVGVVVLGLALTGSDLLVLRRVKKLVRAATRLGAGNLDARTGLSYQAGELGQLAHTFDEMATQLQRREAERQAAEETLRASQERYRTLIEASPDAIVVADLTGSPILANQKAATMVGNSNAAEVIGRPMTDFFAPDDRDRAQEVLRQTIDLGEVRDFNIDLQREGDGATPVEINTALMRDAGGNPRGLLAIIRDVTERREAEERVRVEAERTAALVRSAARLNARLDMDAVLSAICEEAALALKVPVTSVSLYDPADGALHLVEAHGAPLDILRQLSPIPRSTFERDANERGKVFVIPDLEALPDRLDSAFPAELQARTLALATIARDDHLIGALTAVCLKQPRVFSNNELALLQGLADQAAQAIANARMAERTSRHLKRLQALHTIDMAITSSLDLRVTLNVLLDQATTQLGADAANVLMLEPHTNTLEYAAGRGFRSAALEHTRLRLGRGPSGRAAFERRIISVPSLDADPEAASLASLVASEGFVTCYSSPLIAKGNVKGVLELFKRVPFEPDDEWTQFLEALSTQAAIAIDNAGLFDGLQRSNVELTLAYDNTLEGWSRALDLRDEETEGHSRRVTDMTVRLAEAMGISWEQMVHVRRGALLHDIGKMGIPDTILLKPGPLTNEEWTVMRRHPVLAHELLSPIPFLRPALPIPYCHHEKWDGTGYPRGLKGEQIPLEARVFALVDVCDALASERPYRAAWPSELIHDYLRSQSRLHFDPAVVDKFFVLNSPS